MAVVPTSGVRVGGLGIGQGKLSPSCADVEVRLVVTGSLACRGCAVALVGDCGTALQLGGGPSVLLARRVLLVRARRVKELLLASLGLFLKGYLEASLATHVLPAHLRIERAVLLDALKRLDQRLAFAALLLRSCRPLGVFGCPVPSANGATVGTASSLSALGPRCRLNLSVWSQGVRSLAADFVAGLLGSVVFEALSSLATSGLHFWGLRGCHPLLTGVPAGATQVPSSAFAISCQLHSPELLPYLFRRVILVHLSIGFLKTESVWRADRHLLVALSVLFAASLQTLQLLSSTRDSPRADTAFPLAVLALR